MNLNINNWEEFKVGDIFKKSKIKKHSSTPEIEGNIPFISSTSINNGVSTKVNETPILGNCITVSTNGDCFDAFYQKEPIVVSSDVEVLYSDKLNEINAMFFCTILKQEKFKYSYGRKPKKDKVFNTIIKLPILRNEKGEPIIDKNKKYSTKGYIPDFKFIENYIKTLNYQPITTSKESTKSKFYSLEIENWKNFRLGSFFKIKKGKRLIEEDREKGDLEYYSASEFNNGLTDHISNPLFIEENTLIYTTFGDCYYIPHKFTASDEISILKYKDINVYNALFIATVINKNKYKYAYGRKCFKNKFEDEIIKLPICYKEDGKTPIIDKSYTYSTEGYIPDFELMKNYIISLYYSDKI